MSGVRKGSMGYVLDYGADVNIGDEGKYLLVDGRPGGAIIDSLSPSSERVIPKGGALRRIAWNSQTADETTVLKILVDGTPVETVTLTGASGTAAHSTSVARGEKLAVEFDAGTVAGNTGVILYIA